jgi:hypothetical protein
MARRLCTNRADSACPKTANARSEETPAKTKKKGFLGIFKKKETDPASTPPKQPAKKDDDDQGF